jgi:5-formyltetrahydrofolate cyclo-ligase/Flp pilus assembly pilin Flp
VGELDEALARKQALRERVWRRLQEAGAARFPGAWGRIPNFMGAEAAAERLASSPAWQRASVVKVNPDAPQLPVRARALAEGKLLYMAVPRLAAPRPFLALDPARVGPPRRAPSIRGAGRLGVPVALDEISTVDLVVCGSVAVNRSSPETAAPAPAEGTPGAGNRSIPCAQASPHTATRSPSKDHRFPMTTSFRSHEENPTPADHFHQRGQGMVEYALIIVLIAVGVVVALTAFGTQLQTVFNTIVNNLSTAS